MALRLYDHPLSPYSQKIKIALREKGVPFEACLPTGLGSGEQNDGLGAANPRGEVPALVLETGEALFESTVLLEFIEERWPEPPLAPPSALGRARGGRYRGRRQPNGPARVGSDRSERGPLPRGEQIHRHPQLWRWSRRPARTVRSNRRSQRPH